jgi:hypothetical protein
MTATFINDFGRFVANAPVVAAVAADKIAFQDVSAKQPEVATIGSVINAVTPAAKFSTGTNKTTFEAGQLTGANLVVYTNTVSTPGSIATRTATEMFGDDAAAVVGRVYLLRIVNGQGTGTLTVTAGSGVTLTGTATIAINSWREFVVTYTSETALTFQNVGTGTFS